MITVYNGKQMKAIVLSYDQHIKIVDHMIYTYQKLWPSNPFIFRVPYQKYPHFLKEKYGEKIELISTAKDIKPTLQTLLEDIPDHEWVYWCMADRYLIDIKESEVNQIYQWIKSTDPPIGGVLCCRTGGLFNPNQIDFNQTIINKSQKSFLKIQEHLVENENINGYWGREIWLHQFLRTEVLKSLFRLFPDENFAANQMDYYLKDTVQNCPEKCQFNRYVYEKNLVILGESLRRGKITINCVESFQRFGLEVPDEFEVYDKARIIKGKFDNKFTFLKTKIKKFILNKFTKPRTKDK